ncbi:hypothetical protein ACFW9L_37565 [Streptomyces sp. NPDC059517]|uniref:hypothetical protein n=1 Tax=Streptomyces sp. NPDC059517 TaxID=3346855 RepID=UPI0036D1CB9A
MRLGKALATGVAEERPRATDDELPLGEPVDETETAEATERTERTDKAERVERPASASEEVPVAR